jgi:transposase
MEKPHGLPVSDTDWRATPPAVQAQVVWQLQAVQQLTGQVLQLQQQVAQLQQSGGGSGGGGGSPGAAKPEGDTGRSRSRKRSRRRRSSGKKPGAQPGHEGHGRPLLPVEQVDEVVPVQPSSCHHCGHGLAGEDPHPQRHQVVDIPPVRAHVTEYQLHTLRCPHCRLLTEASWPEAVPRSAFGPRVQAWVSLLSGAYRLSKRNIVRLLADAFNLNLSVGSVSRLEQQVSAALAAPVEEACAYVQQQPVVNIDETGWREARDKAWLWTVVSDQVTIFAIRSCHDREVARELLGADTCAVVGSDRHSIYGYLPASQRQACWAHLERAFETFVERGAEAAQVGETLLECSHQMFSWWHRVRDGTLQRSSFQVYLSDLRLRVRFYLWYGQEFADEQTAATCANLLEIEPALWTFARKEGVEPTNNTAERALRHGVLWRHTSFGTHSPAGSRFVERMLTVRDTLRHQQRQVLDYLTRACQAALRRRPAPSLLPAAVAPSA